jgi:hypothetical protein
MTTPSLFSRAWRVTLAAMIAMTAHVMAKARGRVQKLIATLDHVKQKSADQDLVSPIKCVLMAPVQVLASVNGQQTGPVAGLEQNVRHNANPVMNLNNSMAITASVMVLANMNASARVTDRHRIVSA